MILSFNAYIPYWLSLLMASLTQVHPLQSAIALPWRFTLVN